MKRRMSLVAAAAAVGMLVSTAPAATALSQGPLRDHCVGTRIATHVLKNDRGVKIGRVELWYASRAGGQNCVMTYNYGAGKRFTGTFLRVDDNGDLRADRSSSDEGSYQYYAGGSYRNYTNGDCVQWGGMVYGPYPAKHWDDDSFVSRWGHCG